MPSNMPPDAQKLWHALLKMGRTDEACALVRKYWCAAPAPHIVWHDKPFDLDRQLSLQCGCGVWLEFGSRESQKTCPNCGQVYRRRMKHAR